jgi:Carboxypeptidase regulatory-like domain
VGLRLRIITLILLGIILSVSSLFAQTSTGRIADTVTDQSGAAVKGVAVTVVDERTNQERTAATNDDGNYAFTGFQPSSYTLRASQTGFSNTEVKEINLQVGQETRRNLELAVSGTSSVVNVESGAIDAINQSDAKIGVNVSYQVAFKKREILLSNASIRSAINS